VKIKDVHVTVVGTPWRDLTFVELETDDGLTGVGEVRMVNRTETLVACVKELGPRHVVGLDPFNVHQLAWLVQRNDYGRAGEVVQSALAAFDVACWDLMGQSLGVPVWQLLGGLVRERTPAYANGWYQTDPEPALVAEKAKAVVERGYRGLKLDPFGAGNLGISEAELRRSTAIVTAVREVIGPDVEIMLEMHGRFSVGNAVRVAAAFEHLGPAWIEEPVPPENASALARVQMSSRIPVATGERLHTLHDVRPFLELGAVDVLQVDLTHFGGLTPMRALSMWADTHYVELAPHNVCGPIGTLANVHFAVATPNHRILEHFNDFADSWVNDLVDVPAAVGEDGCFGLPRGPGLGARLNHDACAEHPATGGQIALFKPGWEQRLGSTP